ncbi:MAG: phage holin family protein [Xanthomonadales bacterium]|nr:phage holin family protein [Xanthomonadales bacterium]
MTATPTPGADPNRPTRSGAAAPGPGPGPGQDGARPSEQTSEQSRARANRSTSGGTGAAADEATQDNTVTAAAQAVGQLAGEAAQLGLAWFDLARAEAAIARTSAVRLIGGAVIGAVLALCLWIFTCAALATWLAGWLGRTDAALALVAGLHLVLIGLLVWAMRGWLRALQMRRSREALAQLGKAFSP